MGSGRSRRGGRSAATRAATAACAPTRHSRGVVRATARRGYRSAAFPSRSRALQPRRARPLRMRSRWRAAPRGFARWSSRPAARARRLIRSVRPHAPQSDRCPATNLAEWNSRPSWVPAARHRPRYWQLRLLTLRLIFLSDNLRRHPYLPFDRRGRPTSGPPTLARLLQDRNRLRSLSARHARERSATPGVSTWPRSARFVELESRARRLMPIVLDHVVRAVRLDR